MLASPELGHLLAQARVEFAGASDDGRAQREPRQRGKHEDDGDGE